MFSTCILTSCSSLICTLCSEVWWVCIGLYCEQLVSHLEQGHLGGGKRVRKKVKKQRYITIMCILN